MGLRSAIQNKLFHLSRQAVINVHELKFIFFELTHNCNLTCLHCGSDCVKDAQTPDLSAQNVLEVLDDIRSKYNPHRIAVILSGGEPLCYPGVFELGRRITEREFAWHHDDAFDFAGPGFGLEEEEERLRLPRPSRRFEQARPLVESLAPASMRGEYGSSEIGSADEFHLIIRQLRDKTRLEVAEYYLREGTENLFQ